MSRQTEPRTLGNETLVLDMIEWIAKQPRSYTEVMDAWWTSCPRFPVWEDTARLGFVEREYKAGLGAVVRITRAGQALLRSHGRA